MRIILAVEAWLPYALLGDGPCTLEKCPDELAIGQEEVAGRVVNHDVMEGILVLVISDNEVSTFCCVCSEI